MQTVVDINNTFQDIVTAHEQLKSFHTFSLDELDMEKLDVDKYPLLYAQCSSAELDGGVTTFTYEVIVADLVIEKQQELLTQIYAETFLILQLTGWSTQFDIRLPNVIDLCDAPFD